MKLWHLTFSAAGRRALLPGNAGILLAVRLIAAICGRSLVLFCLVDDHLHLVLSATPRERANLARPLHQSLKWVVSGKLEPAHSKEVQGRAHLERLVVYLLQQVVRHGLPIHPALWVGSCFQDLIGARWVPQLTIGLNEVFPRFRLGMAMEAVGLPPTALTPASNEFIRSLGARRLASAAATAMAADPRLRGNRVEVVRARQATALLATQAGLPMSEVSWALLLCRQTPYRLRQATLAEQALTAVRMRLSLEEVVRQERGAVPIPQ